MPEIYDPRNPQPIDMETLFAPLTEKEIADSTAHVTEWDGETLGEVLTQEGNTVTLRFTGYIEGTPNKSKWGTTRVRSDSGTCHYVPLGDPGVTRLKGNPVRIKVSLDAGVVAGSNSGRPESAVAVRGVSGGLYFVSRSQGTEIGRMFASIEKLLGGTISRDLSPDNANQAAHALMKLSGKIRRQL